MAEVTLESVPKKAQDLFNRGFTALERGNLDYAVDMLTACVELEPQLLRAWKFLRAAQVKKVMDKPASALTKAINTAAKVPAFLAATGLLKSGKTQQAMMAAEKLLRQDPVNPKYAKLFGKAAAQNNLPEVAVLTLELARDHNPEDISLLNWLGSLYQKMGRTSSARECFERLCELCPNDGDALKRLKDAMAIDSISSDGWQKASEEGGSYRDILKSKDEATKLEKEAKSQKSDSDSDSLIADLVQKIEDEPANTNFRRSLANLYIKRHAYNEGIAALQEAIKLNPGDPELERAMSNAKTKQFEHRIAGLREAGNEEEAAAVEHELLQFEFDDLQDRVERYPNDLALRYEWGKMLFDNDYVNESIQQFQLAQRNPKSRVRALYYLGLCFKAKKQYDLAMDQLKAASAEVLIMDGMKKDIIYEQGEISELMGEAAQAANFYKEIYQSDISYRDVAQKIEEAYGA
jgi:tetratricopeptide (TPR) repeat protein